MMKRTVNSEHGGFALTLEVLVTLVTMFMFLHLTLYFMQVMNVQRFVGTVMMTTASNASRWGGVNSELYRLNVSSDPNDSLLKVSQEQLDAVIGWCNPTITGYPNNCNHGERITITVSYELPSVWHGLGKVVNPVEGNEVNMYDLNERNTMSVSVYSLVKGGKLWN